jgi:hypothetical protein
MTIRTMTLVLTGGVLASALATGAPANADGWRFIQVYRALGACQAAGQGMVGHRQARAFRCENDYDKSGVPVLDLYVR